MKPKVIFISGLCMSKKLWKEQTEPDLGLTVDAIDLPGQGINQTPTDGSLRSYAMNIRDLVQGEESYVLCGWSLGASIALEYQRLFPNQASGLVLVDGAPKYFKSDDYPCGAESDVLDEFVNAFTEYGKSMYPEMVKGMFKKEPEPEVVEWICREMEKTPIPTAVNSLRSLGEMDFLTTLPEIKIPILIVQGRYDRIYPVAVAEYMAEKVPNAQLRIFEQSAHAPQLEEPERFNAELVEFFRDTNSRTGFKRGEK